jgi:hypothetical protein
MTRILIYILLFLMPLQMQAQKVTVSNKVRLNKNYAKFKLLGKVSNQYVVERVGKNARILDIYDNNLNLRSSRNINLAKRQGFVKTWLQPSSGWVLLRDDDKSFSVLKANKLDGKLNVSQNPMVLDTIFERPDLVANNLRTELSLNESHLAVYLPVFSSGKINYFQFNVYDVNMKLVQKRKITSDAFNQHKFSGVYVLNDGSFVLILEKEKSVNENNTYFIFYGKPGEPLKEYTYVSQETIFRKPKFEVDNIKNDLLVAGMYEYQFDKRKAGGAYKFFTVRINLDSGVEYIHNANEFSNEFYRDLTGKDSPDEVVQLQTFYVNSIIPKADGGMTVLVESYYKTEEERYYNNNMMFYGPTFGSFIPITTYNFNDVLVFDMNELGYISRVQIVRKRQVSENDNGSYSSFFTMNEQDKMRLLFLDEISRQSNLSEFTFSETFTGNKRSIFNTAEKDILPIAKLGVQTGINEVVFPSFFNNQLSLIKIIYPQ